MDRFEKVLESSLKRIASGEATVEECLQQAPEFAGRLRPLLRAAAALTDSQAENLPSAARARIRSRLADHMRTHPVAGVRSGLFGAGVRPSRTRPQARIRLAGGLAAAALALVSVGTAAAQFALPGGPLYGWKLLSEQVWRAIRIDPLQAEIALLQRRADELIRLSGDAEREPLALAAFEEQLNRLLGFDDPGDQARVLEAVLTQLDRLLQEGSPLPDLEQLFEELAPDLEIAPPPGLPLGPGTPGSLPTLPGATAIPTLPGLPPLPTATPGAPVVPPLPTVTVGLPLPTLNPSATLPLPLPTRIPTSTLPVPLPTLIPTPTLPL